MRSPISRMLAAIGLAIFSATVMADPASRVGRISDVEGQVSFRSNAQAGAQVASLNWPVTAMNQLTTSRNGRAELRVGSSVVQINSDSEIEITALDDDVFQLRLNYGSIYLHVRNPEVVRDLKVATPHGSLRLLQPSRLRIDTEVTPDMTAVAVNSGAAQFDGAIANLKITAGKRVEINDNTTRTVAARMDAFDDWSAARDRLLPADGRAESTRYVSSETTGHEELDRYGEWRVVDEYGPAWTPRNVSADWAPYRDGRWTWIEPWGWTWVDNAPWGYAPSHYGRWVWLDARWYWVPGRMAARPVWAPAVVGWVGGPQWSVTVGGRAAPAVGWFPLAPHEAYVPAYRVSATYVERINHSWGTSVPANPHYRNARVAVTVMPQSQFTVHGSPPAPTTMQGPPPPHDPFRRPVPSVSSLAAPAPMPVQSKTMPPPQAAAPVLLQSPAPSQQPPSPRPLPLPSGIQQTNPSPMPPSPLQTAQFPAQPSRLPQAEQGLGQIPQPAQGIPGPTMREPHDRHRNEAQQQAMQQQAMQQQAMQQQAMQQQAMQQQAMQQQAMQQQAMQQRAMQQQAMQQQGMQQQAMQQQAMQRQAVQQHPPHQHQQPPQFQQPAPQGSARDHERAERAAAKQERRQSGEREGGSAH